MRRDKARAGNPLLRRLFDLSLSRQVDVLVHASLDDLVLTAQLIARLKLAHVNLELFLTRGVFGVDVGHLMLEVLHERGETNRGLFADTGAALRVFHHGLLLGDILLNKLYQRMLR